MSIYNRMIDLQNLHRAWDKVRKNKPAEGVDHMTCDAFEAHKKEELKQLFVELSAHEYHALPVKHVTLYKGEKEREIALYSMRDKAVQQSIATVLTKMYDGNFSSQTIAYRPNKSALSAGNEIEQTIREQKYAFALKVDIHHFFDEIQWNQLEHILRQEIKEDDVIELIHENSQTRYLEESGEIMEKTLGIHQGSAISPILSNIYLMDFDEWMLQRAKYFIRYSDDMIVLDDSKENLLSMLGEIRMRLEKKGLKINEKKTICVSLTEGVDFLGYCFSDRGKETPKKAVAGLQERLEIMWLTSGLTIKEKIKKAIEIIGGWRQYFQDNQEMRSIFEFAALAEIGMSQKEKMEYLVNQRRGLINIYKDIASYLADIWGRAGQKGQQLFEYEQFLQVPISKNTAESSVHMDELLGFYKQYMITETEATAVELMQSYTDLGLYEQASYWQERAEQVKTFTNSKVNMCFSSHDRSQLSIQYDSHTVEKMIRIFRGREDAYCKEEFSYGKKRKSEAVLLPLTEKVMRDHLDGTQTIGTYIQRPNGTIRYLIVDIDVSKKVLLHTERGTEEFKSYLLKARQKAAELVSLYHQWGMHGYVEYSGCRGYHVWLFFSEWIPVRYANMLSDLIELKLEKEDDITIEFFPNKTRVKSGKMGQVLKLPFGVHIGSGERSMFVDDQNLPITDINGFLDSVAVYPVTSIKKILAANSNYSDRQSGTGNLEINLSDFGVMNPEVNEILSNCNLMKYLCSKSVKTGYLTHFERLSILYVFGHLGDPGQEFVHKVMSFTLNYQYNITEKFIRKLPEKPISCIKLRDQYKQVTAEYGCSCNFKHTKNCYPSPVLHAIKNSKDMPEYVTLPTSRTVTKEKEKKVAKEINIHMRAQELAGRSVELKKQRRKLDRSILQLEQELGAIFDAEQIDSLEIEMGLLSRRKTEHGYEWVIEI